MADLREEVLQKEQMAKNPQSIRPNRFLYKVAGMVGNSPQVLLKHYKAVKTRMEAEKFWGLKF